MKRHLLSILALTSLASCSSPFSARWETVTVRGIIPDDKARLHFEQESSRSVNRMIDQAWEGRRAHDAAIEGTSADEVFLLWRTSLDAPDTVHLARIEGAVERRPSGLPFRPILSASSEALEIEHAVHQATTVEVDGGGGDDVILVAGPGCRLESLFVQHGGLPEELEGHDFLAPGVEAAWLRGGKGDDLIVAPSSELIAYRVECGPGNDRALVFRCRADASVDGGSGVDEFMFPTGDVGRGWILAGEGHSVRRVRWVEAR
ncbi:MAG: hypothetical protein ACYSWX_00215 [Planctomycetota bacterium]